MRQTARKITTAAIIVLLLAALSAALTISLSACASHRAAVHRGQSEARASNGSPSAAPALNSGPNAVRALNSGQNEVKALCSTLQISALDWLRLNWNYASIRIINTAPFNPAQSTSRDSSGNSDYHDPSDSDNSDYHQKDFSDH